MIRRVAPALPEPGVARRAPGAAPVGDRLRAALHAAGNALHAATDALLPQTCIGCAAAIPGSAGLLCATCRPEIERGLQSPYCPRCGRTLPPSAIHGDACARCRTETFWNVAGVARVGPYTEPLRPMLLSFKYAGQERGTALLAQLLERAIRARAWPEPPDALVPVPMYWLRRLQRPCDHAAVLATALGRRLHVPVVPLVRRSRHAPSQTTLHSRAARFENVRDSFAPKPWYRPPFGPRGHLAGRVVYIIDNLLVSGATVYEVARVLRKAGARRLYAAVLARSPAPGDPLSIPGFTPETWARPPAATQQEKTSPLHL